MRRTLLIDGDIFLYRAAFAAEETHSFDGELHMSSASLDNAKSHFDAHIESLEKRFKSDATVFALSADGNWRKAIYPEYKAQRKVVRRPILLKPLREYVEATRKCYSRPLLEADDVLGILATGTVITGKKLVVSIDKDLLQIPGKHFNPVKADAGVITVTEQEGDYAHMMQTLAGDVVDNYPGCPGVGPKSAAKWLALGDMTWWQAVVVAYEKKGLTEHDALVMAQISRICRACDYDFVARSVIPWTPDL